MLQQKSPENQTNLLNSEWILVGSLVFIMISILVVGTINASRCSSLLAEGAVPVHDLCTVTVEGEVSKPGTFQVPPGTLLKKILRKSSPTPFADLKKFDLDHQRVEGSIHLYVDALTEITIILRGLYPEPVERIVPAGTRVCHLKNFVQDDLTFFQNSLKSRRFLKDREEILFVPDAAREEELQNKT